MQSTIALRSYLMAGVAVAGAGIIAVNPVQPIAPTANPIVRAEVGLAAATGSLAGLVQANEICDATWKCSNPQEFYAAVWNNTVVGTTATWNQFTAAPFPILAAIAGNQKLYNSITGPAVLGTIQSEWKVFTQTIPAYLVAGVQDLFAGNVLGANNNFSLAFNAPLIPLSLLPAPFSQVGANSGYNWNNVVQNLNTQEHLTNAIYGVLGPFISGSGGFATLSQNIINSLKGGSVQDAINWVINAPAVIWDSIVNGGYGPVLYTVPNTIDPLNPLPVAGVVAGGLLNPQKILSLPFAGVLQITSPGSVSSFLNERGYVAKGLCPTAGCVNPIPFQPAAATAAAAVVAPQAAASVEAPAAEPAAPAVEAPAAEPATPKVEIPAALADSAPAAPEAPAAPVHRGSAAAATGDDAGSAAPAPSRGHRGARSAD